MKLEFVIVTFALIALLMFGCSPAPSYIVPETLFSEILNSENPLDPRVIENNWRAFSTLGEAYRADGDLLKAKSIFDSFMAQRFDLKGSEFKSAHYDIMAEFGANLLKSAPEGVAVVVYYDQLFYSVMFAREVLGVKPNTRVIWAKALPVKEYRKHLKKTMGIDIPDDIPLSANPGQKLHESAVQTNFAWLEDSAEVPMFVSATVPPPLRPGENSVSLGIGTLTGVQMTGEERFEREMELLSNVFVLDAAADTTIAHPEMITGLIQWYCDPLLAHGKQRLIDEDSAAYSAMADVLLDRLPSLWKPAAAYLYFSPNASEDDRREKVYIIERYIKLNPHDKSAVRAYQKIIDRDGEL